jgi:thiol-disulfide isomerase/thioredoxin
MRREFTERFTGRGARRLWAWVLSLALVSFSASGVLAAEEKVLKVKKGDVPPTELGLTRDGKLVETTEFSRKVVVVTFWATWCAPCRAEIGYLEALQRKVSKDILQVVAVNIEARDVFRNALRKMNDFQMLVLNDQHKRYADAFGVGGIPHMLIIGKNGKVAAVHRGYSEAFIPTLAQEIAAELVADVKPAADVGNAPAAKAPG